MPSLDACINDVFEPGNIPADPGTPPTVPVLPPNAWDAAAIFIGSGMLRVNAGIPGTAYAGAATFNGAGSFRVLGQIPAWTPAQISTIAWYDADDAGTFSFGTGVNISQWNDKSGNGNHVVQATSGSQPDYDTTNTINGLPVVTFDGIDDRMDKSSLSGWPANNGTAVTVMAVWRHTSNAGNRAFFDISTGSLTNTTGLFHHANSFQLILRATGTANQAVSGINAFVEDVPFQYACTVKSDNREIFINGTANGADTNNNGTSAYTNLRIGTLFQDVFPMEGQLGEMVVFSGNDDTTRQLVEGYLAWKWGLEGNLPGGHPYENAPP
jgi:hypothetical protein